MGSREHMKNTTKVGDGINCARARCLRVGYTGEKIWCIINPETGLKQLYSASYDKYNIFDFLGWDSYYRVRSGPLYCSFPMPPSALSKLGEYEGLLATRSEGPFRYEITGKLSWFDFCKYLVEPAKTW